MGIFDGLQFDSRQFDPGAFGGPQGGILDMLNMFKQQQAVQPSAGFAYGANELNPIDAAGQSQQQAATIPQTAQPAQGQMPAQPQQVQPEGPNRFMTGLEGFINNAHTGPIGAILGGIGGAVTGQSASSNRNQTQQLLIQKGLDPGIAKMVTSNPELLKAVLPQIMGTAGQTDDIKEYQFAKKEEPNLTFQQFMQRKRAVSGEYSLTPQYGTNDKGETVLIQTGKSGEAIQTKLPSGVKISSGVDKVDLGTQWGIIDKRTGQMVGTQPKDLRGAEQQKALGEAEGKAAATLPAGVIEAEATKSKIDDLLKNEGLDSIAGPLDQFRPSWSLGAKGRDALARYNQLKGTAFLQAFATLKGGGAITEIEGQKAEAAIARMDRAQSEEEFKTSLKDFRDAIDVGMKKLRASAGVGTVPAAPAAQTAPASVDDLVKKYSR